ncbi:MAG: CDP-glycerol glycerophosphotransferase family protein [Ruminococcus sp.]|nr:CDP-glycerol glycerophosphotransferase family protein [Ruminococcus sp.]MBQ9515650.1 CDP-glycerol glycerophosphotransferase family protein [Ruminococcus sp.]
MNRFLSAIFGAGFFMTIIKKLDSAIKRLFIALIKPFNPVQEKKIIFLNFTGNYDCNPKAICQEIIDEGIEADLVWTVLKNTRLGPLYFPDEVRCVKRNTYEFFKELASAKVIVDNGISTTFVRYHKKRSQYLIETWHGSLGIKKFGRDANNDKSWLRKAAREGKMTSFIISNSDMEDDIYREDFWKTTPIWKFGHPRNDILLCNDKEKIAALDKSIRRQYDIPKNAKLCMYAPTFRDDRDLRPYMIDYDRLKEVLETRFGGKWVILTRFHMRTKRFLKWNMFPNDVINVGGYPDIQDLMAVIDVGITDYSSWICEYMLRRKPGFTFATDVENYGEHERTLFFPLSALPFPTATDNDQLMQNILNFDEKKFVEDCNAFLKDKGSVDDGHASERTAAEIRKLINS